MNLRSELVCVSVFHPNFSYQILFAAYRVYRGVTKLLYW